MLSNSYARSSALVVTLLTLLGVFFSVSSYKTVGTFYHAINLKLGFISSTIGSINKDFIDLLLIVYFASFMFSGLKETKVLYKVLYVVLAGPFALSLVLGDIEDAAVLWGIVLLLGALKLRVQLFEKSGEIKNECVKIYAAKCVYKTRITHREFVDAAGCIAPLIIASAALKPYMNVYALYLFAIYLTMFVIPAYAVVSRFAEEGIDGDLLVGALTAAFFGWGTSGYLSHLGWSVPSHPLIFAFAVFGALIGSDTVRYLIGRWKYRYKLRNYSFESVVGGAGVFDGIITGGILAVVVYYLLNTDWWIVVLGLVSLYLLSRYMSTVITIFTFLLFGVFLWIVWEAIKDGMPMEYAVMAVIVLAAILLAGLSYAKKSIRF